LGAGLFWEESLFWAQAYFWEKDLFWERPIFGEKDLILEHAQQVAGKQHAVKEGKTTCRRKSNMRASRQA
jgi:hypothetical protein